MTHAWTSFSGEENRHRVGEVFHQNNFGLLEIDWKLREALVTIRNEAGGAQAELRMEL